MRTGKTSGKIILLRWPIGLGPNGMSITLCGRSCGWTVWTKRWALRGKSAPRDVSFRISLQISSAREVIFRSAEGTMEHLNPSVLYGINMEYAEASVAAGSMMALITGQHQSAPESESCSYSECLNLSHAANMTFHEQQNIAHLVMEHSIPHDQTVCVPPASSAIKTRGNGISQPSHLELIRTKEELASFVVNQPALARQARMEMDSQTRCCSTKSTEADALMKAKMVAHPHYPRLVAAYIDCQKVGAPPEIIAQLEETSKEYQGGQQIATMGIGIDPELDQFMEAYCEMLTKYREELTKPFQEATMFLKKIETQLHNLTKSTVKTFPSE